MHSTHETTEQTEPHLIHPCSTFTFCQCYPQNYGRRLRGNLGKISVFNVFCGSLIKGILFLRNKADDVLDGHAQIVAFLRPMIGEDGLRRMFHRGEA